MTVVHPTRPRMVLGPLPAFAYQQCENLRRRGEILIIQNFNLIASLLCLTCRNSYESKREKKLFMRNSVSRCLFIRHLEPKGVTGTELRCLSRDLGRTFRRGRSKGQRAV